ncbi:protein SRC2 homolog [Mangifera indica]|uniref:protein SRC2 homolog n=1 Tax=Mangifera indica TaxID=29780 RepID=UPI001CFA4B15|nr:protein SRC2 homolog [Mangifera indica]
MASPNPLDLEITIISAKHLKNVNWRNGDLKPYVVFYIDSDYRLATHLDDAGSTHPVWNERFTLPITRPVRESILSLEIFHSKVSETPKPLVGSVKFPLAHLVDADESTQSVRNLELLRPSGRPQGKIRVKLAIKERPLPVPSQDYQNAPDYSHYYYSAPPPFPSPSRDFGYYPGYYSSQPPRPMFGRPSSYSFPSGSVPSAPIDYSANDQKLPPLPPRSMYGVPVGSGPSAPVDYAPYDQKLPKQFGGLSLEEEVNKKEKEKRAESEMASREGYNYSDYRHDY